MGKKTFQNKLLKYTVFGLDTSCFIYHFEKHPKYSLLTRELFLLLEKKKAVVSSLVFSELLAKKEIFANSKKRALYKTAFQTLPNTKICDFDLELAEYAAGFRILYNLRLPDAIHLATALINGADAFITNDEGFKKVKEIKVIVLKDYLD